MRHALFIGRVSKMRIGGGFFRPAHVFVGGCLQRCVQERALTITTSFFVLQENMCNVNGHDDVGGDYGDNKIDLRYGNGHVYQLGYSREQTITLAYHLRLGIRELHRVVFVVHDGVENKWRNNLI